MKPKEDRAHDEKDYAKLRKSSEMLKRREVPTRNKRKRAEQRNRARPHADE